MEAKQLKCHPSMTMGKGATYAASCKQKLNTKSSTETEQIAVNDSMVQILWRRHFLVEQGLHVPTTTIYKTTRVLFYGQKSAEILAQRDPFFMKDRTKKVK